MLTDRQMTTNVACHIKPVKVCGQRTRPALQLRGIIGIILGVILAIWLAGMGSRRDLRNARDVPIAGLIAMAVFIVVRPVARRPRRG